MTDVTPLRDLLAALPSDTTFTPTGVLELLDHIDAGGVIDMSRKGPEADPGNSWAEKLWTVPPETRLGVVELCEALRKPRSFVYRATSMSHSDPLPGRKFGGEWCFRADSVRAWVERQERNP